jgi:hypothetical protein
MPAAAEGGDHGGVVALHGVRDHLDSLSAGLGQRSSQSACAVSMRRKDYILSATLTAALIGLAVYLYGGHQTPVGQPPLERLTTQNVAELRNAFNAAKDDVRVLLLLSPT